MRHAAINPRWPPRHAPYDLNGNGPWTDRISESCLQGEANVSEHVHRRLGCDPAGSWLGRDWVLRSNGRSIPLEDEVGAATD